jgi:hypothetical protein
MPDRERSGNMSKKTLWILVLVLAALSVATWKNGSRPSLPAGRSGGGGPLLPNMDMGTVHAIAIEDGASTTHLARVDGIWCVSEPETYPADFMRLRTLMQSIDGMKAGQIADEGADRLAEYGLAAGESPAPLRITLEHDQGTTVLSLGKMREPRGGEQPWGPTPGRYVRVDEGPVQLLKDDIPLAQADPDQWWDRLLLEVAPESIRQVEMSSADGAYVLQRGSNELFSLVGAAAGEEVDVAAAQRLFGALRSLRAERRLLSDAPATVAAFTNANQYQAEADGITYRVSIGEAPSDGGGARPLKIEATAAADAAPERQSAATSAGKKLNNRTFLVPAYLADPMRLKKEELVRSPAPIPEPAPSPAEAPPVDPPALEAPSSEAAES